MFILHITCSLKKAFIHFKGVSSVLGSGLQAVEEIGDHDMRLGSCRLVERQVGTCRPGEGWPWGHDE